MTVSIQLNLSEALSTEELQHLTAAAMQRGTSIERILYEAAHAFCRANPLKPTHQPEGAAATVAMGA